LGRSASLLVAQRNFPCSLSESLSEDLTFSTVFYKFFPDYRLSLPPAVYSSSLHGLFRGLVKFRERRRDLLTIFFYSLHFTSFLWKKPLVFLAFFCERTVSSLKSVFTPGSCMRDARIGFPPPFLYRFAAFFLPLTCFLTAPSALYLPFILKLRP